uniref:Calmodulin n=2 Tax=Macrostomum lignano TaxID=282301 RepID=A0A1I8GYQ5_9PLAT
RKMTSSSSSSSTELKRLLGIDGSVEMTEDDLTQCMGEIVDAHLKRDVQSMEFYDFASLVCSKKAKKRRSTHAVLFSIFGFLDKDQDGFIGAQELKETMDVLGEIGTDEKVNKMIGQLDRGGTGKVSYEDFQLMSSKSAGSNGGQSNSGSEDSEIDDLPEVPPIRSTRLRRLSRRPSSPTALRGRYKPLSRSASLTVADFTSQWCEVFRMFDSNLDGVLSADELGGKMRNLGYNVTQTEVEDLIHEWDKDDKGALSLTEFTLMMNSSRFQAGTESAATQPSFLSDGARDTKELLELKAAFDLFDRDKNGFLDAGEVKIALELLGENPTDSEVDFIMTEADSDRDGAVSFREFCDIVLGRSLSPRSPFYFHRRGANLARWKEEEDRVRLEYQTDHLSARTG